MQIKRKNVMRNTVLPCLALGLAACTSAPPSDTSDLCRIFDEKDGIWNSWEKAARRASAEYGVPVSVIMATIKQESSFQAKARPPRTRLLGFIPWKRSTTAYGYAQAVDGTWQDYLNATGGGNDRDAFDDAAMFVAWYHHQSWKRNRIPRDDAYHLYLAYHEGQAGFRRGKWKNKPALRKVAARVQQQAHIYDIQYSGCQ
jgi:hypothetical protein